MELPRFLRELMSRPEYRNPNSDEYIKVQKYFNLLYPGTAQTDITGRLGTPKYDMTLRDFIKLRAEIESDFEESKQEAEQEILDQFGEYFENLGTDFNIEDYIVSQESINVTVLYPTGDIRNMTIDINGLDIPDFKKQAKVWRRHSEQMDTTCDECASLDGKVFFDPDDAPEIPIHPNCKCSISEDTLDDNGNTIHSKTYKGPPMPQEKKNESPANMQISIKGINWLKSKENKVLNKDGMHVIYDDKTGKPVSVGEPLPDGATIGYGHLIKPGEDFSKGLTEQQALELYRQDLQDAQNIVRNNIHVPLNQHQFDALTSLAYNIGVDNFSKSTIVKYVNGANEEKLEYPTPEAAWKVWNKSRGKVMRGLINRRNDEWEMYSKGIYKM